MLFFRGRHTLIVSWKLCIKMDIEELFADGGVLSRTLPTYSARHEQIAMAREVENTLSGGCAVLEAGTGIGKTFAYLIPIIQSGLSALISTGARGLQDQISQNDIPLLAKALNRNINMTVLKGRSNYLCRDAVKKNSAVFNHELIQEETGEWQVIQQFMAQTDSGEISEIKGISQRSPIWQAVTSTKETCDVQACDHYNECFLYKARARAKNADIIIVNHHLFLSDVTLRDSGVAEILPSRDVLLFDEAHILPQLAPQFFSKSLSTKQLSRLLILLERTIIDQVTINNDITAHSKRLQASINTLLSLGDNLPNSRYSVTEVTKQTDLAKAINQMSVMLQGLTEALLPHIDKSEKLSKTTLQIKEYWQFLNKWQQTDSSVDEDSMLTIHWLEKNQNHITLFMAPISGRHYFKRQWQTTKAIILTSATLSIANDFKNFCEEIGIDKSHAKSWDSPYDFANRTLLYQPPNLPLTNDSEHTKAVVNAAIPLIRVNKGRAFILFSSLRAMDTAADLLTKALSKDDIIIFKQGDMPNDTLLRQFKTTPQSILIGSQSFWHGVNVQGPALSLVVVDKIPFTPPNDPILMARDEWRKQRGEDSFMHNQLPNAVILMKQVAGRLMRDFNDYGIFMVGDTRLKTRGYGKKILQSLPPMKPCFNNDEAVSFLQSFLPDSHNSK